VLGPQDLWIALALGVFFFGAKKLPELSRSLGQAMSEFKKGVATGHEEESAPHPADAAKAEPAKVEAAKPAAAATAEAAKVEPRPEGTA
jgi:TatA/E family protein of Tat protein translocase